MLFLIYTSLVFSQTDKLNEVVIHVQSNSSGHLTNGLNVDTLQIDSLTILPAEETAAILALLPQTDIRTRGPKDVQFDLQLRGGNFDQTAVFINGLPYLNPQTGHHAFQLPLSFDWISSMQIYQGAASYFAGANAYAGLINLKTEASASGWKLNAQAGEFGYARLSGKADLRRQKIRLMLATALARSDGYLIDQPVNNTDFFTRQHFAYFTGQSGKFAFLWQGGLLDKSFGANSFYTSKYPWQYEHVSGQYTGGKLRYTHTNTIAELYATANFFKDRFELFRESVFKKNGDYYINGTDTAAYASGVYYRGANLHMSQAYTGGARLFYRGFTLEWRSTYEQITGNRLGESLVPNKTRVVDGILLNKQARRIYGQFILNYTVNKKFWQLKAGNNLLFYQNQSYFFPGVDFQIRLKSVYTGLHLAKAFRMPTFTDLYYQGPENEGNPHLKPEQSLTAELYFGGKMRNIQWKTGLYHRLGTNTIDWIKFDPAAKWKPRNLTRLQTTGWYGQSRFLFQSPWINRLEINWLWQYMKKNNDGFHSKYVLDYLKQKFVIALVQKPAKNWTLTWLATYKNRDGNYIVYQNGQYVVKPYKPYWNLDFKIYYQIQSNLSIYIDIQNLTNEKNYDLSHIAIPGRWITAGIQWQSKAFGKNQ